MRGRGLQLGLEIIGLCGLLPRSGRSVCLGESPANLKAIVLSNDNDGFKGVLDLYSDVVQGLALFSEFRLVGEDVGPADCQGHSTPNAPSVLFCAFPRPASPTSSTYAVGCPSPT